MEQQETVQRLTNIVAELATLPFSADDAERIDRVAVLDRVMAAASAAQMSLTCEFATSQIAAQAAQGVPEARRGRGVAEQIAYARKISPATAARQLTTAQALTREMRKTYVLLAVGAISAWVATLVARETVVLDPPERARVDSQLAPDLPAMSPREAETAARRLCIEADPQAAVRHASKARKDRRVSLRPAPDTMAVLSALVPVEQGVAAWASLDSHARTLRATGDPRSLDQLRSDTLIERINGQPSADIVPVEIRLIMPVDSLLDEGDEAATLDGFGPIPADVARDIATRAGATRAGASEDEIRRARTFIRRIFTDPIDDTAVHVDPRARTFTGALARFIRARDQWCRDPYCTAPVRHLDHATPHRSGGETTADNGQGRCERGNYVKEMPGWSATPDGPDRVSSVTTPTGHTYPSRPPPALGPGANVRQRRHRAALRRVRFLQRERAARQRPPPTRSEQRPRMR